MYTNKIESLNNSTDEAGFCIKSNSNQGKSDLDCGLLQRFKGRVSNLANNESSMLLVSASKNFLGHCERRVSWFGQLVSMSLLPFHKVR